MSDPLGLISNTQLGPVQSAQPAHAADKQGPGFKDVLLKNIEQVNKLQLDAEQAIEDLATGRRDDVAGVLIAKEKADMAFKMLLQVRNKLMEAYQEIKDIRV